MPDCKCGRTYGAKPHCVHCGSTNIYSIKSQDRTVEIEGEKYNDRAFQCRACGMPFRESMDCSAPPTKEVTRMLNDYSFTQQNDPVTKAKQLRQAAAELIMTKVALGERKLTQKEEDSFQQKYGLSLSHALCMPIVDAPISQDINPSESEGPGLTLATLEDPEIKKPN